MKKQIILFLVTIIGLNSYSQITFEKGYYIDNSNQIVDCLIKNKDWESNPTKFDYKLPDSSEQRTLTIKSVKEFVILNKSKYVRHTVNIDRSSEIFQKLSNDISPFFSEEEVFLRVLIEGKANLYVFNDEGLLRYFFNYDNSDVEQLVHKSYLTSNNRVLKNNLFRQQLMDNLKCQEISIIVFQNLDYTRKDLVNLFVKYNECHNSEFINFEDKQKRDLFNLTIRPGLNSSSLYIQNSLIYYHDVDFGSTWGFRFGIEAELILPFKNNKLAVAIEPTFQYFKSSVTKISNHTTGEEINAYINYQSIEFPFSFRYYLFLSDKSKLFINASLVYDISFGSTIDIIRDDGLQLKSLDILGKLNWSVVGFGYKYNDRYSLEIRYQYGKDILGQYIAWTSTYNTFSIVVGYSLF